MSVYTKKSDTHEERYYHFQWEPTMSRLRGATIYARRSNVSGAWMATGAFCHKDDTFDRNRGRNTARRRFFNSPKHRISILGDMTYEKAHRLARLAEEIWAP